MKEQVERERRKREEEIGELKESILQKSMVSKEYDTIIEQYKDSIKEIKKSNKHLQDRNSLLESKL